LTKIKDIVENVDELPNIILPNMAHLLILCVFTKIGYDDTVRDAWSGGVLMSVGVMTVGVMTVGVMSVGEITVGVMTVGVMTVG
jgi:hypothetical protein